MSSGVNPVAGGASGFPKRFYEAASVGEQGDGFAVLLDGKPLRTPGRASLTVPSRALAEAIAAEWNAQGERIDPRTMPLTKIANSAIDGVRGREAETVADIAAYAASDLLSYRAEEPEELIDLQARHWDPVLAWARDVLGIDLATTQGVRPVAQAPGIVERVVGALGGLDPFRLTALHVITTLTGSALLTLALLHGALSPDEVWTAAHVDEDWQIDRWGEDAEAVERRAGRRREFDAAMRVLALL